MKSFRHISIMACSSRISQIVNRSITTGDFYTGLKYLKLSTPTTEYSSPAFPCPPTAIVTSGCRTTGRHAVKIVAITCDQRAIRKGVIGTTGQTITPPLRDGVSTGFGGGAPSSLAGNNAGTTPQRAARHYAQSRAQPPWIGFIGTNSRDAAGIGGGTPPGADDGPESGKPPGPSLPPMGGDAAIPPGGSDSSGGGGADAGSSTTPMVRPPIQVPGVHGAYASALFSAASKRGKLEEVEQDLIKIRDIYKNDTKLQTFLLAPDVPLALKLEGVQSFKKLNITDLSFNLLTTLTQNRRMPKLLLVIAGYLEMMNAHRGIVECEIISARQMKPEQKEKLLNTLVKFLPGKTANILEKIDPSLIGGFVIHVGPQHIDMSLRRMFNKYEALIKLPA